MPNRASHYRLAEEYLDKAHALSNALSKTANEGIVFAHDAAAIQAVVSQQIAIAQVHATLAAAMPMPSDIEEAKLAIEETEIGWAGDAQATTFYATYEEAEEYMGNPKRFIRTVAGPWFEAPEDSRG